MEAGWPDALTLDTEAWMSSRETMSCGSQWWLSSSSGPLMSEDFRGGWTMVMTGAWRKPLHCELSFKVVDNSYCKKDTQVGGGNSHCFHWKMRQKTAEKKALKKAKSFDSEETGERWILVYFFNRPWIFFLLGKVAKILKLAQLGGFPRCPVETLLPMQELWVPPLARELSSYMPDGQKTTTKKQKQYCNTFIKDFQNSLR